MTLQHQELVFKSLYHGGPPYGYKAPGFSIDSVYDTEYRMILNTNSYQDLVKKNYNKSCEDKLRIQENKTSMYPSVGHCGHNIK